MSLLLFRQSVTTVTTQTTQCSTTQLTCWSVLTSGRHHCFSVDLSNSFHSAPHLTFCFLTEPNAKVSQHQLWITAIASMQLTATHTTCGTDTINKTHRSSRNTTQLKCQGVLTSGGHPCFSVDLSNQFHSQRSKHQQSIIYGKISAING